MNGRGRNQLLHCRNEMPSGEECRVHRHQHGSAAPGPTFRLSEPRIDWRTLHGVDCHTVVSLGS